MRGNILVIDDEKEIYEDIREGLPAHNEFYAEKVAGAKDKFVRKGIDLIFMDLELDKKLDRKAGLDYIKTVRDKYPDVRILVLSKFNVPEYIQTAMKNGADEYMYKPYWNFFSEEFREYVNKQVRSKKKQDERRKAIEEEWLGSFDPDEKELEQIRYMGGGQHSCWVFAEKGISGEKVADLIHFYAHKDTRSRLPESIDLSLHDPQQLMDMLRLKHGTKKENIFRMSHRNMLIVKGIEYVDHSVHKAIWELIRGGRFIESNEPLKVQFVLLTETSPDILVEENKLDLVLAKGIPVLQIKPLRQKKKGLPAIINTYLESRGYPSSAIGKQLLQTFLDYSYPFNYTELYHLLGKTLAHHEATHRNDPKNHPVEWSSLPDELSRPKLALNQMKREVARVEMEFIERALQKFSDERTQKSLAAEAVGAISADNLKKTYIDKYLEQYPEIIFTFPTIVEVYKLRKP